MAGAEAPQGLGVRSYREAWHVLKVPRCSHCTPVHLLGCQALRGQCWHEPPGLWLRGDLMAGLSHCRATVGPGGLRGQQPLPPVGSGWATFGWGLTQGL